jgi:GT2 family glycosyltransferase
MSLSAAYIIVLNYNSWLDTIECVESLLQQDYPDYKIIVVDNGSSNDSVLQLETWSATAATKYGISFDTLLYQKNQFIEKEIHDNSIVHFIWSDTNSGYASGNNIGIRYSNLHSKDHFIWLLNNDTIVMKDTLQQLVACYQQSNGHKKTGLVGCLQRYYHNPAQVQCLYGQYNPFLGLPKEYGSGYSVEEVSSLPDKPIDYLSGACLLTHTDVLKETGLLCEDYFLFYEELDFARRLQKAGYALVFCKTTSILHKHGVSINDGTKKNGATPLADFHHFRSEFIFVRKFYRSYLPLYLFVCGLQLTNRLIKGRFKNIPYVIKGVSAGLKKKPGISNY